MNYRAEKIFEIYTNGIIDRDWRIQGSLSLSYGLQFAQKLIGIFNEDDSYSATYTVLDRHELTANPTNVKLTYSKNIRSAIDDVVTKQTDIATNVSVNTRQIYNMLVRIHALEG